MQDQINGTTRLATLEGIKRRADINEAFSILSCAFICPSYLRHAF